MQKKALNQTCLRASRLCERVRVRVRVSDRQWSLQSEDQNQPTDTGWVCWFPQPAEQKAHLVLFYMQQAERGNDRLFWGGVAETGNDINSICNTVNNHVQKW